MQVAIAVVIEFFTEKVKMADSRGGDSAEVLAQRVEDQDAASRIQSENKTLVIPQKGERGRVVNNRGIDHDLHFNLGMRGVELLQTVICSVQQPKFVFPGRTYEPGLDRKGRIDAVRGYDFK